MTLSKRIIALTGMAAVTIAVTDARLLAYVSEQTGRPEVSVLTVDGPLARDVLSVGVAINPPGAGMDGSCSSSIRRDRGVKQKILGANAARLLGL
jgi:hypothetical protein